MSQKFWLTTSILLLLSSLQRQEIFAVFFLFIFISLISSYEKINKKIYFFITTGLTGIGFLVLNYSIIAGEIDVIFREMGLYNIDSSQAARTVFYYKSFNIANDYFPIGSGLGTYAGLGAKVFGSNLYYEYGFYNYWWFNENKFLMDTVWPHYFAEGGYFGLIFLTISMFFLMKTFNIKNIKISNYNYYNFVAFYSFIFILICSLTAPVFSSLLQLFIAFIFISTFKTCQRQITKNINLL